MTKLEELLEWMDDAEYAPSYGELREKIKQLITEEQQVKNCDLADVVCSCETPDKRGGKFEIILADKYGTDVDVWVDYCENCGHVFKLYEY